MKHTETVKNDKQEREARMRALIKKEAFALMAEQGLDKVSMREIAEKVKVTKPVLYYYFKDKEDLCRSIIDDHEEKFNHILEEAYRAGLSPEETLRQALFSHLEFFTKNPENSKFVIQMISYTLNHLQMRPNRKGAGPRSLMMAYLAREEKAGRIPKGSSLDVMQLLSALSAEIMISAYLQQHVYKDAGDGFSCTKDSLARLVKIIALGIQQYYKEQKK